MKVPPQTALGYGLAINNPLVSPTRILGWALEEARECATHLLRSENLEQREQIQDLVVRERIGTAYQPIVSIADRTVLGFEALSRGAHGTGLESAAELFGAATRHHLLVELDRLCRSRALLNSTRLPSNARLFVNTLPATIRDPLFRGQALIDFLDQAQLAPTRLVIEITERLVIENYGLFQETMAYFTDLGMSFAIDDVGAGYSGLEAIARLKPAYLKIDMGLVRDVHVSLVNREMVKAIVALGRGIGAAVIAEGIQTEEELNAVAETGAEYGQGYYLARPEGG
jgi:EAL domain-containing protein (putative c-di-GMP-specific phosphodiesterase class I)